MAKRSLVTVIDDDESVRESLPELVKELGYRVSSYASATTFLTSDDLNKTNCLLLDVGMPGMTGTDLLRELRARSIEIPVIFITAHEGEAARPLLIAQGAIDCLFKPFSEMALRDALANALGGR